MKRQGDKWFVVDLQGLYIESGHPDMHSASEHANTRGLPCKVMTKPRVGNLDLPPDDASSWRPKRENPSARKVRSNPALEEHVEYEPQRTVRSLRNRYGQAAVEGMLHENPGERFDYTHYVVVDDKLNSGWSFVEDARDAASEANDEGRGPARVVSKVGAKRLGLDPDDARSWADGRTPNENPRLNPSAAPGSRGEDIYRMWHQKEPRSHSTVRLACDWDDELKCVGKAHNIVYRSGKWQKGNKTEDYIHHFDSKPSVYMLPQHVDGGATKSVKQLFGPLRNPAGQAEVAQLATPLSFALDDGSSEGQEITIHTGAKVYGGVDKKTVLIDDPVLGPIVIKGGKMYFDERGIVL
jgi:hypothetical protein